MRTEGVDWRVYVVTDVPTAKGRNLVDVVQAAIQGGASVVQLREKEASAREMFEMGRAIHAITTAAGVPLIVNDRIDLALALGAEGVHVGQQDLPAIHTKRIIPPEMILGVSATNRDEAIQAEKDGADYLGVGDVFGTPSKPDACPLIGAKNLADIVGVVNVPVVAIGGITLQNASQAVAAGAAGLAVISAVIGAADPERAARELLAAFDH